MTAQQKREEDLPCVCSQLRRTARLVSVYYDAALAPAGLTVTQFALLARVGRHDGLSRTVLAAQLGMDRTTLTRNLLPLERQGLILSKPGADRREKLLHLTAAGRKQHAAARPFWAAAQRGVVGHMGVDRLESLRGLLEQTELGVVSQS